MSAVSTEAILFSGFAQELDAAIRRWPEASDDVAQFWIDVQQTLGIEACVPYPDGVVALCRFAEGANAETVIYSWSDLETEWAAWYELA